MIKSGAGVSPAEQSLSTFKISERDARTTSIGNRLRQYLEDPFLNHLYTEIRGAGRLRSISVDITNVCNLRCHGCYFFSEEMDRYSAPTNDADFDAFVAQEKARGTNFVTVVGGEPSLTLNRLKKLHLQFWINVATNGLIRIPYQGFENMPIGVSVWGDRAIDQRLRGSGKIDSFARALENYRNDPRVFWYYAVTSGNAYEIESVVDQCVNNGNYVLFNFYGDLSGLGVPFDHRNGFAEARNQIDRMIQRYPERILMTSYLSKVVSTGRLYDEQWGHEVCTSISPDHYANRDRIRNGKPFNPHFRAYNADLKSTRRCCTGIDRECESCFDVWEHFSWIMLNLRKHLASKQEFTWWLTTTYMFYLINRIVDFESGIQVLPEIHERCRGRGFAEVGSGSPASEICMGTRGRAAAPFHRAAPASILGE
ncbi:radical SAM protein [bacterium]|nr:radical SAM protein [bacterium]MCI0618605.1 radical SAM protein [bacterium]